MAIGPQQEKTDNQTMPRKMRDRPVMGLPDFGRRCFRPWAVDQHSYRWRASRWSRHTYQEGFGRTVLSTLLVELPATRV